MSRICGMRFADDRSSIGENATGRVVVASSGAIPTLKNTR